MIWRICLSFISILFLSFSFGKDTYQHYVLEDLSIIDVECEQQQQLMYQIMLIITLREDVRNISRCPSNYFTVRGLICIFSISRCNRVQIKGSR